MHASEDMRLQEHVFSHIRTFARTGHWQWGGAGEGLNYERKAMDGGGKPRAGRANMSFPSSDTPKTPGPSKPTTRFASCPPFSFRQDGSRTEAADPVWLAWRASEGP